MAWLQLKPGPADGWPQWRGRSASLWCSLARPPFSKVSRPANGVSTPLPPLPEKRSPLPQRRKKHSKPSGVPSRKPATDGGHVPETRAAPLPPRRANTGYRPQEDYRRRRTELTNQIGALMKESSWRDALDVLRDMQEGLPKPNTITYNVLLDNFGRIRLWGNTLKLLDEMRSVNLPLDKFSYDTSTKWLVKWGKLEEAKELMDEMQRQGFELNSAVAKDYLANSGARRGGTDWRQALQLLLGSMKRGRSLRSVVEQLAGESGRKAHAAKDQGVSDLRAHCNLLLLGCAQSGCTDLACQLLVEMKNMGLTPESYEFNMMLRACRTAGQGDLAASVIQTMQRAGIQLSRLDFNIAILACAQGAQWEMAIRLKTLMEKLGLSPDIATYQAVGSALLVEGKSDLAIAMLREAQEKGRVGHGAEHQELFALAIRTCGNSGDWERALDLLGQLDDAGCRMDEALCSAAIAACGASGELSHALSLLDSMASIRVAPGTIAYTASIRACATAGEPGIALHLLSRMSDENVARTTETFNSAIAACKEDRQWHVAIRLLSELCADNLSPTVVTFHSAMNACAGNLAKCEALFREMAQRGLSPTTQSHNALMYAMLEAGEWRKVLNSLRTLRAQALRPDIATFGILLGAYKLSDQWEGSLKLLALMQRIGIPPDLGAYQSVLTTCAAHGRWSESLALVDDLISDGLEAGINQWTSVIYALNSGTDVGRWRGVLAILETIRQRGLQPTQATDMLATRALVLADRPVEAETLIRESMDSGEMRDLITTQGIDLHGCSKEVAMTLARMAVKDRVKQPQRLDLIIGRGLSASDEAVLGPVMMELLQEELGLKVKANSPGLLVVEAAEFERIRASVDN